MFTRSVQSELERLQCCKSHFAKYDQTKEYRVHESKVHSVGWNCDGSRLASGSFDRSVNVYTIEKYKLNKEQSFRGHEGSVDQLCWNPCDPWLLATASSDRTIRVWDIRAKKPSSSKVVTKGENINITWSPDGKTIAVGNKEDLITFIETRRFSVFAEKQFSFEVNEITFNPKSSLFFLTAGNGYIHVFTYPDLEVLHVWKAHSAACICIKVDPTGNMFAVGAADALVSLWSIKEPTTCIGMLTRLEWPVRALSFSHDGEIIASASEDLFIDIAETRGCQQIVKLAVDAPTFTIAWHPREYVLALATDDSDRSNQSSGSIKLYAPRK